MSSKLPFILLPVIAAALAFSIGRSHFQPQTLPGVAPPAVLEESPAAIPRTETAPDPTSAGRATAEQLARGARVYRMVCMACHMPDGKGLLSVTPPLAGSDYMLGDRERAIRVVLKGLSGPITVDTIEYDGTMPPLEAALTDRQVADVLTHVFNSWGNQGDAFAPEHVARVRTQAP